jgi:small Trp-rich protein
MYFVILGVLLILLNLAGIGPMGDWVWVTDQGSFIRGDWWKMLWPFAVAFVWWQYADKVGLTQKRAIDKMEDRKTERRRKHLVALGINPRDRERSDRMRKTRQDEVAKVESKRDGARKHNKEVIARSSQFDTSQVDPHDHKS